MDIMIRLLLLVMGRGRLLRVYRWKTPGAEFHLGILSLRGRGGDIGIARIILGEGLGEISEFLLRFLFLGRVEGFLKLPHSLT